MQKKANYIAKKVVIFRNKYLGVIVPLTKTICSPVIFLKHKTDNPSKIINQIIIQMNLFVIQNEFLFYLSKILKTDIVNMKMLVAYERNKVYLEKLAICMKKCKSQVNSGPKTIQLKVPKKIYLYITCFILCLRNIILLMISMLSKPQKSGNTLFQTRL